ncbi:MAG: FHA domain-containing protein, partial [Gemmatimonadales bacterium]
MTGRERGAYYLLETEVVVVGRDETCDIQIVDQKVSRRHMELHRAGADGGYSV